MLNVPERLLIYDYFRDHLLNGHSHGYALSGRKFGTANSRGRDIVGSRED